MALDKREEQDSGAGISKALLDAVVLLELIAQGKKEIREGQVMPQEEVSARVSSKWQKGS